MDLGAPRCINSMIKDALKAYEKDGVSGASGVLHAYRYFLAEHQGVDVSGLYYEYIEAELSQEISLMRLMAVMPKRMNRDRFKAWRLKVDKREMKITIEKNGIQEEITTIQDLTEDFELINKKVKRKYETKAREDKNGKLYGEKVYIS